MRNKKKVPNQKTGQKKKPVAGKQLQLIKMMFIIGGVGLLVIIIMASLVANFISNDQKKNTPDPDQQQQEQQVEEDENAKYIRMTGLIQSVDDSIGQVQVYNVIDEESVTLNIDGTVELKDEYGEPMTLAQFRTGDMIQAKYNESDGKPEFFRISAETWEHANIQNIIVKPEESVVQYANTNYHYTDQLITKYRNQPFDLATLTETDEVTMRGYKDKVWAIILERGHGYISINDYASFKEGTVDIDNKKTVQIKDAGKIEVTEGAHKIYVYREGMETYEVPVMVEQGQTVNIDIGESKPKVGAVQFDVNVAQPEIYVDGTLQEKIDEPILLNYGSHEVVVKKTDYQEWKKTITIKEAFTRINVSLQQQAKFIHISNPEGAEIYIDDNFIGYAPISIPIEVGQHEVLLRKEGYQPKKYPIYVTEDNKDTQYTFPNLVPINEDNSTPEDTGTDPEVNDPVEENELPVTDTLKQEKEQDQEEEDLDPWADTAPPNTPGEDVYGG